MGLRMRFVLSILCSALLPILTGAGEIYGVIVEGKSPVGEGLSSFVFLHNRKVNRKPLTPDSAFQESSAIPSGFFISYICDLFSSFMCGRYRRTTQEEELARLYHIPIPRQTDLPISYNIAPSQRS